MMGPAEPPIAEAGEDPQAAPRSRGRPPKEREPRRHKIITTAADLFIKRGYSDTTLEAVAKGAGVNKRTIYELVGDKEQLFREVCFHSSTIDELDFSDTIDEGSVRNSLIALGTRVLEHGLSDQTIALERAIITEFRKFPELIDEIVTANFLEANKRVSEFLTRLQNLDMISVKDISEYSMLFFDIVVGQLVTRKVLGQSHIEYDPKYVSERVDLFITLIFSNQARV